MAFRRKVFRIPFEQIQFGYYTVFSQELNYSTHCFSKKHIGKTPLKIEVKIKDNSSKSVKKKDLPPLKKRCLYLCLSNSFLLNLKYEHLHNVDVGG